jgi:hypothetical protein
LAATARIFAKRYTHFRYTYFAEAQFSATSTVGSTDGKGRNETEAGRKRRGYGGRECGGV